MLAHGEGDRTASVTLLATPYARLCCRGVCMIRSGRGSMEEAERQVFSVARTVVSSLQEVDPDVEWKLGASVRAIDSCLSPITEDHSSPKSSDPSYLLYVKLTLSGDRGTIAVGDSYAVLPTFEKETDEREDDQAPTRPYEKNALLLTGACLCCYASVAPREDYARYAVFVCHCRTSGAWSNTFVQESGKKKAVGQLRCVSLT